MEKITVAYIRNGNPELKFFLVKFFLREKYQLQ